MRSQTKIICLLEIVEQYIYNKNYDLLALALSILRFSLGSYHCAQPALVPGLECDFKWSFHWNVAKQLRAVNKPLSNVLRSRRLVLSLSVSGTPSLSLSFARSVMHTSAVLSFLRSLNPNVLLFG